ncbi:MAG: hypothetical protein ABIJ12_09170, partial [bacterium]
FCRDEEFITTSTLTPKTSWQQAVFVLSRPMEFKSGAKLKLNVSYSSINKEWNFDVTGDFC